MFAFSKPAQFSSALRIFLSDGIRPADFHFRNPEALIATANGTAANRLAKGLRNRAIGYARVPAKKQIKVSLMQSVYQWHDRSAAIAYSTAAGVCIVLYIAPTILNYKTTPTNTATRFLGALSHLTWQAIKIPIFLSDQFISPCKAFPWRSARLPKS